MKVFFIFLFLSIALVAAVGGWGLASGDWIIPSLTHAQNKLLALALFGVSWAAVTAFTLEMEE